jgi:hypothetical protein
MRRGAEMVQEYLFYCPYCPFASDYKGDMGMHLEVIHLRPTNDYMLHPHRYLRFGRILYPFFPNEEGRYDG